jgi:hypothetical protein
MWESYPVGHQQVRIAKEREVVCCRKELDCARVKMMQLFSSKAFTHG